MNTQEIVISLLKDRDQIPAKTILFHLINNNLINITFTHEFEMANDKYIVFNDTTFLHLSVFYHHMDVCKELVKNGAIVTSLYIDSQPVLNLLDLYFDNYQNLNEEIEIEKDIRFLVSLLPENDITEALYRDREFKFNYNIVSILLDFGANPNDYRALDMVKNDEILFRIFVTYGFDINRRDQEGNTFLHLSVYKYDEETIGWLLMNGADKTARNWEGKTPYDYIDYDGYDIDFLQ